MEDKQVKRTPVPIPSTEVLLSQILGELKKISKAQDQNSHLDQLQWFNTRQAALYYGGCSEDYFRRIVKQYRIPQHGQRKLFNRFELDEFIENSHCFLNSNNQSPRKSRGSSMAAIQNALLFAVRDSLQNLTDNTE